MPAREERCIFLRKYGVISLGAILYALLYALGSQIDQSGCVNGLLTVKRFAFAVPVAAAVLYVLFHWLLPRLEFERDLGQGKPFCAVKVWLVIFISYVPMFILQYPGSYVYDSTIQMLQIAYHDYSRFHPLLHTLLLAFCVSFHKVLPSVELCYALYSVIQMLLVSGCFALACASVARSVSRKAAGIAVFFFILYPSHMVFASNCTKDVLFSAFCLLFAALCLEEVRLGSLSTWLRVLQLVSGVLACLLRNNMIYAVAAWLVVLLISGKRFWRMLVCGIAVVFVARYGNIALAVVTDAWSGSVLEMMSVPLQQLSRARLNAPDVFLPEEAALMDMIFEDVTAEKQPAPAAYEYYSPTISDPVKQKMSKGIMKANMSEFWSLWLEVGKKVPGEYLDAFLNLILPSIYPYREYRVSQGYIEAGGDLALLEESGLGPIERSTRFQAIRDWLHKHIFRTGANHIPVIRYVFNIGLIYWMLLLFALFELYEARYERMAVLMMPVLLYGTYLLGPVMIGRYVYPFVCMLPLFVLRPKRDT